MTRYIGIAMLIIGVGLLVYSSTFDPFTDKNGFYEKMESVMGEESRSQKFHEIRDSYLTPKFNLEDYGLICVILGLYTLVLLPKKWQHFKTPKHKAVIILIGALAVLLTIGGYVGDLFLEMTRDRYPPWADSLVIPLMAVPMLFLIFSGWFAINLIGLKNPFNTSVSIMELDIKSINYWYLALVILTIILTLIMIYEGDFWLTAAGVMWVYFYIILLLGQQKKKIKNHPKIKTTRFH